MILITSLRNEEFIRFRRQYNKMRIKPNEIREVIVSLFARLYYFDKKLFHQISGFYIINESEFRVEYLDLSNISKGKISSTIKKDNPKLLFIDKNQFNIICRLRERAIILNKNEYEDEKLVKLVSSSEIIFYISNMAGQRTISFIKGFPFSFLHPVQNNLYLRKFTEIEDKIRYFEVVEKVDSERKMAQKIKPFVEKADNIFEVIDNDVLGKVISHSKTNKIFLQGGDNYLIEKIIKYFLQGESISYFLHFKDGVPDFVTGFDTLILLNISLLTPAQISNFWAKLMIYDISDKLIIITSKENTFRTELPDGYSRISVPAINDFRDNLLRILIFFINKNPKLKVEWEVPKDYSLNELNEYLSDIGEISQIIRIIEKMDLRIYIDMIFTPDFWFDFINIKKQDIETNPPEAIHKIKGFLRTLPSKERGVWDSHIPTCHIIKLSESKFQIILPSGKKKELDNYEGLNFFFWLIEVGKKESGAISVEKLYEYAIGLKYKGPVDKLLDKIRKSKNYLFDIVFRDAGISSELGPLKNCMRISNNGCFYSPKVNLRIVTEIKQILTDIDNNPN